MLVELVITLVFELPELVYGLFNRGVTCEKCGGRYKYVQRDSNLVQCVMCERLAPAHRAWGTKGNGNHVS
jgi:hypothetical protein